MDYLKTRAPFWKKEHPAKGCEHTWVQSRESDLKRVDRWTARSPKR
jgi:molybdopterin synthase catalytic subunit